MDKQELAKKIFEVSHLTGNFTLRSGRTATEYFDKYQFEAQPEILDAVAQHMAKLIPPGTQVLAGLEMGAISVVAMLSHYSGIPAAFVRKKSKGYGTDRLAEGTELVGKKVLVIEDIVTSGGQVGLSTADMRALGAEITHALCVIDRQEGGREKLAEEGIELISLFTKSDLSS